MSLVDEAGDSDGVDEAEDERDSFDPGRERGQSDRKGLHSMDVGRGLDSHHATEAAQVDLPRTGFDRVRAWFRDWVGPFRSVASDRALVVVAVTLVVVTVVLSVVLLGGSAAV